MFATVPFGMNAQEMNSWLHYGGIEPRRELYARFNLVPLPRVLVEANGMVIQQGLAAP